MIVQLPAQPTLSTTQIEYIPGLMSENGIGNGRVGSDIAGLDVPIVQGLYPGWTILIPGADNGLIHGAFILTLKIMDTTAK
jgi:hypothetical protein